MRIFTLLLATAGLPAALLAAPLSAQSAPRPGADEDDMQALQLAPELPPETPAELRARLENPTPVSALTEALTRTYWTNPTLVAQRAATRSIDYRIPQARAAFGPKLSATASYGWQRDNFEIVEGTYFAEHGWAATAQAVLTQPVFTFGRNAAGERYALAQRDYQRYVLRSAEQQAMLDAITAYVGVLRDRAGVIIAQDNLALLEQELKDNRERLKAREVTSTDLQQVETRVELGRAQLLAARRAAAGSEASFLRVVGAPAGQGAAPNPLQLPAQTLEDAYTFAELHNPVLFAAKAREQVSRAQVSAARADMRPRVDLRGVGAVGTVTPYSNDLRQTTLRGEVLLTAPIYQGGQLTNRLAELQAANDGDWRLMDAAFRDNRAAVADTWA
jgi:outer membrane protein